MPLENDIWCWHADYVLDTSVVIDNQGTSSWNFSRNGRPPYLHNCLQVLLYARLLSQVTGPPCRSRLYHRSWNPWGEIEVYENGERVIWGGDINGQPRDGEFETTLDAHTVPLEDYWHRMELPPRLETPFTDSFDCTRNRRGTYYAACPFLGVCRPSLRAPARSGHQPRYRRECRPLT